MLKFAKTPRIRDRKYLDWLRELECVTCSKSAPVNSPVEASHIRKNTGGGMGLKSGDNFALPLCHFHHDLQHRWGEVTYWKDKLDDAIALAKSIYEVRFNRDEAISLIKKAQL